MPALVNISVGSSLITMGAEGTMACCFCSKNFLNESRISLAVIISFYYLTIINYQLSIIHYTLSIRASPSNLAAKVQKNQNNE